MAEPSSKNKASEEEEDGNELGLSLEKLNLGPKKKLLIMGLGGFLCHRVCRRKGSSKIPKHRRPDASLGSFHVYKRPFCEDFMRFCLERFEVGIWSSAKEWYLDNALDCITPGLRRKLVFAWDQTECTRTCFFDLQNKYKPIFIKELKKVWEGTDVGLLRLPTQFSSSNTLLIDNEPYKALLNPPNTAIFPNEYMVDDVNDSGLGVGSELRLYLEKVAEAEEVPGFIRSHPFSYLENLPFLHNILIGTSIPESLENMGYNLHFHFDYSQVMCLYDPNPTYDGVIKIVAFGSWDFSLS